MNTSTRTAEALTVIPAGVLAGVGPRRVGGWYQDAHWGEPYYVAAIEVNQGGFSITERYANEWTSRTHSDPWVEGHDIVISQPADGEVRP